MNFRIAPTPSGFLHRGNAFNFILTWLLARSSGAALRLRIDDLDAVRVRPGYIIDIFETLAWLRIDWQDGPRDVADHYARFSQSFRITRYDEIIRELIATGEVFACDCSRKDILAVSPDGQYPGTCRERGLPLDVAGMALRLRTPRTATISFSDGLSGPIEGYPSINTSDPIIRRRDGLPSYHIGSIADDLDHCITHIVRGHDLLESTVAQLFISQRLGGTPFENTTFFHHPILKDSSGSKLSKSAGSSSLQERRTQGADPGEIYRQFSHFMHWPLEVVSLEQALQAFAEFGAEKMRGAIHCR